MALFLAPFTLLFSQNYVDALRYSQDLSSGTARFNALSGAFSALGGDMSSIGLNPASSSVFIQNQVSFSTALYNKSHSTNLNGTISESSKLDFIISNAGGVFIFENSNRGSLWQKFAIGITYNQTGTFEDYIEARGTTSNSLGSFFRSQANGFPLSSLQTQGGESISDRYAFLGNTEGPTAQNAFLGYQGYVIDPALDNPNNSVYNSNTGSGNYRHDYFLYSDGFGGKYTLNLSTQFNNNFTFGLNLNTHSIDYQQASVHIERNSNENSSVKRIDFENYLNVFGNGFSFQLGGIAKVNEALRVSLYYDSPTWFSISEETTQYLETIRLEEGIEFNTVVDPRIINFYYRYDLRTPYKIGAGAAYVFGLNGLISIDYSYKDYSSSRFSPGNTPYFSEQNNTINSLLTGSSSIKIGSEYRWNFLSFRGGFLYEQSPFKDTELMSDRIGFSMGLGYNGGNYMFDFAYNRSEQDVQQSILSNNNFNRNTVFDNFVLTLNVNL